MEKELAPTTAFALLDELHEGVALATDDGSIIYLNTAARRLLRLNEQVDHLFQIDQDLIPGWVWDTLLDEAPASVTTRSLALESRWQQWQEQTIIQLLLEPVVDGGIVEKRLDALARISRELNATLLLEDILESVMREALDNTRATGALIALVDRAGKEQLRLQKGDVVATPEANREARNGQTSVNVTELRRSGQLRSALVTPILFEGQVAGLINLYGESPRDFGRQAENFVTALANHAAIAIGNARRFAEIKERNTLLQQRTQQIEQFVESSRAFHSDRPLAEVYEDLVYAIQEGVGYNTVLLSLTERAPEGWTLRGITAAGLPLDRVEEIRQTRQPWTAVAKLMQPEYAVGGAYLVPSARIRSVNPSLTLRQIDNLFPTVRPRLEGGAEEQRQQSDLFFIPMRDSQGNPLGLIALASAPDGQPPDLNTARVLEIFANQAANAIENVQLFHDMRDYALELHQLHNVSQQTLREPDLDRKLQLIVDGLQTAGWGRVSLTLRDEEYRPTRLVTGGLSAAEERRYRQHMLPASEWRRRFDDPTFARFRRGSCYYIPHDAEESTAGGPFGISGGTEIAAEANAWHPDDVLIRPLYDREGTPVGILGLDDPLDGNQPGERALQTIDLYAQFAISIIENYRLFSETDRRRQELQTLFEASRALSGSLDQDEILQAIGEHMLRAVNADAFTIYALRREQEKISILHNSAPVEIVETALRDSRYELVRLELARRVLTTEAPATRLVHIESEGIHPDQSGALPAYTITVLPLTIRDEMFGFVEMIALEKVPVEGTGGLAEDQLQLLGAILNQASVALEIAHLFEELDERVALRTQALAAESERVKILLRIATELTTSLDQTRVLNLALQLVNDVVHSAHGQILLVDEDTDELIIRAALGSGTEIPAEGLSSGLRRDEGLAGHVIETRKAVVIGDLERDERWQEKRPGGARSALAVPLVGGDEVLGTMMLTDPRPNLFTEEQLSLVEAAGIQVANATHNASLYDLTRRQANKLGLMMREAQVEVAKQQSILQSIADGVLVAEADGTIVMVNPPAAQILDTPRQRLIGRSLNELMGLYGESGGDWLETIAEWARHPQTLGEQTSLKNRLDIEDKIVLVHVAPVFASSRYFGTISIFRDITKEVEVDRMKSEFVSTVSHELRTPMTSIKGYADLLMMGAAGELSDSQLRHLDVIKRNADRLQLLVNDLLDISRIETGKTRLAVEPFDLTQVVDAVVDNHLQGRIQHEQKDISVETALAPSLPLLEADPEKITRVLTNLVDNAFNYTPPGGSIKISARANGQFLWVSVQDSGIGISEADQRNVFDRFFRAENAQVRDVPGTGLGLAIVSSLIEMHGGRLSLESTLGEGSTFTFSLPLTAEKGRTS